jgi:hypothetical protein
VVPGQGISGFNEAASLGFIHLQAQVGLENP